MDELGAIQLSDRRGREAAFRSGTGVEVLSPSSVNASRDRETKLKLYSRRGVQEYWLVSLQELNVEVYQRKGEWLSLSRTVKSSDTLESSLIPGFAAEVNRFFFHPLTRDS